VAQEQAPPHSASTSGMAFWMAASITVEPFTAWTVRASPVESMKVMLGMISRGHRQRAAKPPFKLRWM
jgi:hypothetical protein